MSNLLIYKKIYHNNLELKEIYTMCSKQVHNMYRFMYHYICKLRIHLISQYFPPSWEIWVFPPFLPTLSITSIKWICPQNVVLWRTTNDHSQQIFAHQCCKLSFMCKENGIPQYTWHPFASGCIGKCVFDPPKPLAGVPLRGVVLRSVDLGSVFIFRVSSCILTRKRKRIWLYNVLLTSSTENRMELPHIRLPLT